MITDRQIQAITEVIKQHPAVVLAYLFGSRASGDTGPLSDYDIAVQAREGLSKTQSVDLRLELAAELGKALETDKVDLVLLNQVDKPALKYTIISEGRLLFEKSPYQMLVEPRILNEYFDLQTNLIRHNLTKATMPV